MVASRTIHSMKNVTRLLAFLVSWAACIASLQAQTGGHPDQPVVATLCELLKSPQAFIGKSVTVDVHITSMKEGSNIWSPDCSKLGLVLVTTLEGGQESGIPDLRKELTQYQKASRPVLALLTGTYEPDYPDEIRHRKYAVFKAYAAKAVRRSSSSSRR